MARIRTDESYDDVICLLREQIGTNTDAAAINFLLSLIAANGGIQDERFIFQLPPRRPFVSSEPEEKQMIRVYVDIGYFDLIQRTKHLIGLSADSANDRAAVNFALGCFGAQANYGLKIPPLTQLRGRSDD